MMEVYGTQTSPFTRIVRIVAMEVAINLELRELFWRKSPDTLFKLNPGGRVPLLVDETRQLGESRAICSYLMDHELARPIHSFRRLPWTGPQRWDEEHLLGLMYSAMEGLVVIRVLADPPAVSHPYIERSRERIHNCFQTINEHAKRGYLIDAETFGMAEAALITAADAIEGRNAANLSSYQHVQAIRMRFASRPSVVETAPRFN